jgi:hypothetical protein
MLNKFLMSLGGNGNGRGKMALATKDSFGIVTQDTYYSQNEPGVVDDDQDHDNDLYFCTFDSLYHSLAFGFKVSFAL